MKLYIATNNHIDALCDLLTSLFSQEEEFVPNREWQESGLRKIIENPDIGVIFVAEKRGEIIGMVSLLYTISTAKGGRVALLEDMVVAEKYRGQGVGSALLSHAVEYGKADGCSRITLLTDESNTLARKFYTNHGFTQSPMIPYRKSL